MEIQTWETSSELPKQLIEICNDAGPNEDRRVVLLGTRKQEDMEAMIPGLQPMHMYQVTAVFPAEKLSDEDRIFVRNPSGKGEAAIVSEDGETIQPRDGNDDGIFALTVSEVSQAFDLLVAAPKS